MNTALKTSLTPWETINSVGDICVYDLEGNGLMPGLSRLHCAVLIDLGTLQEFRYRRDQMDAFLVKLSTYKVAVGHNVAGFDFKALKKLYRYLYSGWIFDTLVLSRLVNPERPQGHSLGSWGHSLKFLKGVFGETTNWAEFSEEMLEYCAQDVRLNAVLFLYFVRNLGWEETMHCTTEWLKETEAKIRRHELEVVDCG